MNDFAERSAAYAKRAKALETANKKASGFIALLNLGTLVFIAISIVVMWSRLDAKVLVGIAVVTFFVRWFANFLLNVLWTTPTMKRIDEDAPKPPPRETLTGGLK